MMKRIILFFLFISSLSCLKAQLIIGAEQNIDVYLPLTETAQKYELNKNDLKTNTFSLFLNYSIPLNHKFSFSGGLSYKQIKYEVSNIIKEIQYNEYSSSSGNLLSTGFFETDIGYHSISKSFGLNFSFLYSLVNKKKANHQIGIGAMGYIFEHYTGDFFGDYGKNAPQDQWYNYYTFNRPSSGIYDYGRGFKLSNVNLCTYYRFVFQFHEKFSLAARVSLGTNLYSDWDQFKKYAWLGLGLELGFGKVRGKKSE
jgi:hypothetical protein